MNRKIDGFNNNKSSIVNKIKVVSLLALTAGLMTACGKNGSFVSGVNVVLQEQSGEEWVGVSTTLNTGLASLPSMTYPIYDKNHTRQLMQIQLSNTGGKKPKTVIAITTNLSKLDDLPQCDGGATLLPNGSNIPLVDTSKKVYCVPVGKQTGRVYIAAHAETKELALGLALTIKEFQGISKKVGKMDLFLPFEAKNISGVYGFFTGKDVAQSGLGLFFDLSQIVNPDASQGTTPSPLLTSKSLESTTTQEQLMLKSIMDLQSQSRVLGLH